MFESQLVTHNVSRLQELLNCQKATAVEFSTEERERGRQRDAKKKEKTKNNERKRGERKRVEKGKGER